MKEMDLKGEEALDREIWCSKSLGTRLTCASEEMFALNFK